PPADPGRVTGEDTVYPGPGGKRVAMKNCAPRHAAAARGAAQDASRAHLRLVEPPSAALSSDDHARGLPTQRINHDLDDDPPLTVLAR
ncbi:hypothetical protein, partial [Mycobacterium sp.]|uniref:hypothetical protein n=1 Tax=Mycobacterium sp. TaxID=1785 RepID=UPI003C764797